MSRPCPRCGTPRDIGTDCAGCGLEWTVAQERLQRTTDELNRLLTVGPFDLDRFSALAKDFSAIATQLVEEAGK